MGYNYYTHIWKAVLPEIDKGLPIALEFGEPYGGPLPEEMFLSSGNRQKYSFTVTYIDGYAPTKEGSAVCRDLQEVLEAHRPFRDFAKGKEITFRLDSKFLFSMTVRNND